MTHWYRRQSGAFRTFTVVVFVLAAVGASVGATANGEGFPGLLPVAFAAFLWTAVAALVWKTVSWIYGRSHSRWRR